MLHEVHLHLPLHGLLLEGHALHVLLGLHGREAPALRSQASITGCHSDGTQGQPLRSSLHRCTAYLLEPRTPHVRPGAKALLLRVKHAKGLLLWLLEGGALAELRLKLSEPLLVAKALRRHLLLEVLGLQLLLHLHLGGHLGGLLLLHAELLLLLLREHVGLLLLLRLHDAHHLSIALTLRMASSTVMHCSLATFLLLAKWISKAVREWVSPADKASHLQVGLTKPCWPPKAWGCCKEL